MYRAARARTYELLQAGASGSLSRSIDLFIMGLIAVNVIAVVLATVDTLFVAYRTLFELFELVSVLAFSVEYVARVWSCVENPEYAHPVFGRLRFATRPYLIVDLVAILPFFVTSIVDLRFLRSFRLFRFFRLFKFARYSESMRTFGIVIREKSSDLLISLFATGVLLTVASSLMYFAERSAQPEAFSSIPVSLWWGVITLTTVGYGDVTPTTPLGRAIGGLIALVGVGLVALPASILASGFIETAGSDQGGNDAPSEGERREFDPSYCPHCGEPLHPDERTD